MLKLLNVHSVSRGVNLTWVIPGFLISLGMIHLGPLSPAKPHLKIEEKSSKYLIQLNTIINNN